MRVALGGELQADRMHVGLVAVTPADLAKGPAELDLRPLQEPEVVRPTPSGE
jgi:hypothetical protein